MKKKVIVTGSLPGMKAIEEIVSTCIVSATLKDANPISVMIVSESGAGKSQTLVRYQSSFVHRVDDLTSQGLFDILEADPKNKIRFIVIPDFNPVLSHKPAVTNLLMANLLTIMSEGIVSVADGRQKKELKHKPVGIITACTRDLFLKAHRKFSALGIVRRIIPIHYGYSLETISQAQESVRLENFKVNQLSKIRLKTVNGWEPTINKEIALKIEGRSERLAASLAVRSYMEGKERKWYQGEPMYPMAPHAILRTLAKAHAKLYNRKKVQETDISFLNSFIQFTSAQSVTML